MESSSWLTWLTLEKCDNLWTKSLKMPLPCRKGGLRSFLSTHLKGATECVNRIASAPVRKPCSINWLGSAWKWIAGNPDAADWNTILATQKVPLKNSDQQLRINSRLFDATHESITNKRGHRNSNCH
uniref:AT17684p n=1 Tax=Drosophila melanogaster TaxID=7227 RepID=Q8T449_DROME|nr:AT17684p [Drosophila melanogaster]